MPGKASALYFGVVAVVCFAFAAVQLVFGDGLTAAIGWFAAGCISGGAMFDVLRCSQ